MTDAERFAVIEDREKGLRRGLTSAQLSMIAIGGAIGTGLFLGSSFAIGFAGPSVIVSYVIGALIALLLMGCLAEMTVAHPTSGSFGAWAEFYISPLAGYLVRYAYWSAIVFAVGTEVTAIAVYMRYWFPAVPGWVWIVGFSVHPGRGKRVQRESVWGRGVCLFQPEGHGDCGVHRAWAGG